MSQNFILSSDNYCQFEILELCNVLRSAFVIERKSKVFDEGCALVLANVRSIVLFTLNNFSVLMELQITYSKLLTTLGLLLTVVFDGKRIRNKQFLDT